MPLGYAFKRALKPASRYQRRLDVMLYIVFGAIVLTEAGVSSRPLSSVLLLYLVLLVRADASRKRCSIPVSSLDERAYLRYGREFEQLNEVQQKETLARYRVGTYLMMPKPAAGAEQMLRDGKAKAQRDANRLLHWYAVPCALLFIGRWYLLPAGERLSAWTVWTNYLFVTVLTAIAPTQTALEVA